MNTEISSTSDEEPSRPSGVHLPDAPSAYAAYAVVYGSNEGPPVGLILAVALYRGRPAYLELHGASCTCTRLWIDHRQFAEYPFADAFDLVVTPPLDERLRVDDDQGSREGQ